ncbi:hypothetical protein [Pseudoalteromonas luteoviolacea]|uniref:Type II secretion system protein GspG C-terminal domain-containing protein n=1 Tax=Pseudoalteromonas luteoviolacea S4054 TaxID=1129367 RepID=A0A0F6AAV7_9GAMM|nr:hypothetical protein [Pseudoalteromonas luteoviolacea]AOT08641.1 hypothetical protein S4054249_12595 [Pseudoalteromonas luteoviolacea]AOT13556.1 hypothetical protein S40542_12570 [Pseudoalteromonas luteoviolacea]AOT18469.1 hypothetical protein S4054_12570 [Pseudoalteromonas luteoviolacea]KKE82534.1 hypothetical protein N479_18170 [Pseudoalteromonas luteoviolacea S4054]KZN72071.1 hypothetical protein N481_16805 [Pseudoalteromonas luteoviolacea S4047-1]
MKKYFVYALAVSLLSAGLFATMVNLIRCTSNPLIEKVELDILLLRTAVIAYDKLLNKDISQLQNFYELSQTSPNLLKDMPLDPWDKPYGFEYLGGESKAFIIWSKGSIYLEEGLIMYLFKKEGNTYQQSLLTMQSDELENHH